jgi:hypothetical protein
MSPRIKSEDNPPAVTTPRKILSEIRGLVVISRGAGMAADWFSINVMRGILYEVGKD